MVLLLLIQLARVVFYSRTFWNAFKVLKVPKPRRKIRPPLLNRHHHNPIQTPPSSDPLTHAQRIRRTKIRELTQLCLVWVIWIHSKRFLDWIAWAIPFYDELNLVFLIWLIVMGPSAAETVFTHSINRIVTPYEQSFDSILGTTHDILQITIYLITSAPRQLSLKWKKWKARQFTKSLRSAPTAAPPTRSNAPLSYHPQLQKSKHELFSAPPSARQVSFDAVPTQAGSSTYLVVPERKPIPSRKLSDGYRRSVSNNRPKGFVSDTAIYNTRLVSANRAVYPLRSGSTSALLATNLNGSKITKSTVNSQVPLFKLSSKENMHQFNHALNQNQTKEEENNSIIIHDDSMSIHEADVMPASSICGPPVKVSRQKRFRNVNDDDSLAFHKAKKVLRATSVKGTTKLNISKTIKTPFQASNVTGTPKTLNNHQFEKPSQNLSSEPCMLPESLHVRNLQSTPSALQPASSAAGPMADVLFSQSTPEDPIVPRRLHNPDEPLPPPDPQPRQLEPFSLQDCLPHEHEEIREKALNSVRSLISSADLPPQSSDIQQDGHPSKNISSQPCPLPGLSYTQGLQAPSSSSQPSSTAVDPTSNVALSPSKVEAPIVPRRLHHPDEPLPLPGSQVHRYEPFSLLDSLSHEHEEIREKALNSVRSLASTTDFPSPSRSTGWLAQRLPSSITDNTITTTHTTTTSSTSPESKKSNRKIHHRSSIDNSTSIKKEVHQLIDDDVHLKQIDKLKRFKIKREISGKLGQQNKTNLMAKQNCLLDSSSSQPQPQSGSQIRIPSSSLLPNNDLPNQESFNSFS